MSDWFASHPKVQAALVFAFVAALTALGNRLARLESAEQWEATKRDRPRLAALIHLARGLGVDPAKVLNSLAVLFAGRWPPPTGTAPITAPAAVVAADAPPTLHRVGKWFAETSFAFALLALVACSSTPTAATVQRDAGVTALSLAGAARVIDEACAGIALGVARGGDKDRGAAIARTCDTAYERTRAELLALGYGLDAWADGTAGAPACAMLDTGDAIRAQLVAARAFGAKVPEAVDSAVGIAAALVADKLGRCVRSDGGLDG